MGEIPRRGAAVLPLRAQADQREGVLRLRRSSLGVDRAHFARSRDTSIAGDSSFLAKRGAADALEVSTETI